MKGWLDNYGKADNANDSDVSLSEGFVGLGYNTEGRKFSPAWGGQFQDGGQLIPVSPMQQIIGQAPSGVSPTVPYLKTKDPVEFYKSWIQSPEYARRQLLTGYSPSAEDESLAVPSAAASRQTRLESLQNIDPITYSTRQPSESRPGVYGISSTVNINPLDYIDTNRGMVEAHELAHIAGAMESEGTTRPGVMSAREQEIFKKSMLPMKEPVLSGSQGSQQREASRRALEDFEHSKKPKELKADLDALRFTMYDKGIYDITKGKKFTESDFEKAKQSLGKDRVFKRLENRVGKKNFVNLMNTIAKADEEELPLAMGGMSIPGSVGFTYARTSGSAPSEGKYAKKTIPSAQKGENDIEKISINDPRYPELYKNRQVGSYYDGAFTLPDLPEFVVEGKDESLKEAMSQGSGRFLQGLAGVIGAPQAVTMELLTGKQQTPSEAFGFQQPGGWLDSYSSFGKNLGNFAMDAVLDPVNLLGVGLVDDVARGTARALSNPIIKETAQEFIPEKIVFDLMDESIDPFGQVLKNIKIDNTPSPFAKDVRREAFKYQQLASDPRYLERVKNIDRDFGSRLEPLLNQFKNDEIENVGQYFPFNISVADRIPYSYGGDEVDVLGISGLNTEGFIKDKLNKKAKRISKITPSTDRYIEINEPRHIKENIPARGTVHHELKHHWTNALNDPENKNYSQALKNLISRRSELGIDPRDVTTNQNYNYLSSPTEVDAYLMTNLRDDMVNRGYLKDHFDELTEDKLNDFILKEKDIRDVKEYFSPGREMIFDRSKFVDFFNKYGLPSTVIGGVLGGQAIDQQKNGGITKDNRGYWNPDNWGKPVEIDSNDITMEGVYEPLLGISDTGDTKLMKPGKNYKFKGKKVTEFPLVAKDGGKFMNQYTINQGDTLSKISKETGYSVEQLAKLNNIEDPNKIYAGQKLTIPYKFDKSLSIKEIPQEHHKNIVIDDYSKSFNYLVQGDKVYYAKKNSDNWVDISDNNKAKGNLYTHIDDKYGMKGYSDYEKSIRKSIADSTYNYDNSYNQRYSTAPTNYVKAPKKSPESLELKGVSINSFNNSFKQPKALPVVNDPFGRLSRMVPNYQAKEESNPIVDYLSDMYDKASDFATDVKEGVSEYVDLGANWLDRQYNKQSDAREESSYIKEPIITNSEYSINQPIITGDTLRIDDDRYYLPEVMDLNEFTFKNRNRNELTPIETDAASITAFNPFQEYDAVKKSNYPKDANFIGVDSKGNFKSGSLDQFGPKDKLSRVFKNNVESFVTDKNNEMKFVKWNDNTIINGKRVGNKDNPNSYVPLVNVIGDDGNKTVGTLNLLVKSPKELGTFGQITGGRLIFKQGDKQILVSGSVKDIKSQFDKLSKNGPVEVLTLDNGSYSRGLRTYDKQLSPQQLQEYDRQNVSGGHFLYSTGQKTSNKYPEERFQTPNIRTKKDESYKQGHPLKNELQGVVLHQTAYSEKDLSKVHKQFMTPNKNSAHVLIGYDGERRIYADPEQVTFHGGVSSFKGRENVNDFMLGLEFQGVAGKDKLTDEQIESAVEYLTPIIRKYNIPIEHITSHAAVAPGRKHDVSNDDLEKIYKIIRDRLYNKKRNGGVVGINQLDAQPMKKLNQLLNFTNNPDKDNWLDKYN